MILHVNNSENWEEGQRWGFVLIYTWMPPPPPQDKIILEKNIDMNVPCCCDFQWLIVKQNSKSIYILAKKAFPIMDHF